MKQNKNTDLITTILVKGWMGGNDILQHGQMTRLLPIFYLESVITLHNELMFVYMNKFQAFQALFH